MVPLPHPQFTSTPTLSCCSTYIIYYYIRYRFIYVYIYILYHFLWHIAHWRSTKLKSENQTRVNFDLSREQCGAASAPIILLSLLYIYIYIYLCVCAYREPLDQKAKRRLYYTAKNNIDCFFIYNTHTHAYTYSKVCV